MLETLLSFPAINNCGSCGNYEVAIDEKFLFFYLCVPELSLLNQRQYSTAG